MYSQIRGRQFLDYCNLLSALKKIIKIDVLRVDRSDNCDLYAFLDILSCLLAKRLNFGRLSAY